MTTYPVPTFDSFCFILKKELLTDLLNMEY